MKPTNRVRAFTRWPSDREVRLEKAYTDLAFCNAIYGIYIAAGCGDDIPECVDRIHWAAIDCLNQSREAA